MVAKADESQSLPRPMRSRGGASSFFGGVAAILAKLKPMLSSADTQVSDLRARVAAEYVFNFRLDRLGTITVRFCIFMMRTPNQIMY